MTEEPPAARAPMADPARRLSTNVEGDFFVDETCIDCDACREIAPASFARVGDQSAVVEQPATGADRVRATMALVSCPTGSIGGKNAPVARAVSSLPSPIEDEVSFVGWTSESSFGAMSYLIRRPDGNVLVDSPRFTKPLVRRLEEMGGVATIALTHRDDVADHERFSRHFGAFRVIHRDDVTKGTRGVERQVEGESPVEIGPDLVMIPTPGHTRGHAVFLYRNRFLFTGDHLAWSRSRGHLYAFRGACWYSWEEQIRSMKRLREISFEWVLPGHGARVQLAADTMRADLDRCIAWMER